MSDGSSRWRKTKRGREPKDERMQQICARLRQGATYKEIAAEFSISIGRVAQIREYAGIERRHKARVDETSTTETQNHGG